MTLVFTGFDELSILKCVVNLLLTVVFYQSNFWISCYARHF